VQKVVPWHYHLSMQALIQLRQLAPIRQMKSLLAYGAKNTSGLSSGSSKARAFEIACLGMLICIGTAAAAPKAKTGTPQSPPNQSANETIKNSNLSAELMLEILLGELNNVEGVPATGYSLLLDAARKSRDQGLYKRAIDIALHARSGPSALEAARAWKNAYPSSKEANRYVLDILIAVNKIEPSEEPLRTDLLLTPLNEQAKAIAQIPQLYSQANNKTTAATVVEQALNVFKTRSDTAAVTWVTIAKMRLLANLSESSLQALRKGLQAEPESPLGALLAIDLASTHTPGAEELVGPALDLQTNPSIRLQWVRGLIEMDRLNEAGEQLIKITVKSPKFPDGWLLLGSLQLELAQFDKAEESLKTYLKLASEFPDLVNSQGMGQAYLMMAQIAQKQNNENLADSWLSKIEDPQLALRAQFQRASILAGKGNLKEAIHFIERLPIISREELRSKVLAKAQLYRDSKDFESAYNTLSKYLNTHPTDVDISYELSMLAEKLQRYAEMEKILRSIIATHPDYAQAYNALGFSLADRNLMLPEAKKLIVKALEFLPNDPFITDSLGWVEYRLGNNSEALAILERAYASKTDAEIAAHLGEVMWALKKNDAALKVWREGLKINPNNEVLKETVTRLKAPL